MKGEIREVHEGAHSELGPSSAERWLECPGSVLACRGKPDIPSEYAIEGTAAHTVSEWVRRQGKPASAFKGIKVRVIHSQGHDDVYCGEPMVKSVQEFVDRAAGQPGEKLIEERVHYDQYVPGGFGTGDHFALNDWLCFVMDFKHGTGVKKNAKMNPQLLLYALGIYLKYGWRYMFDTFLLSICQPRLKHFDEWPIRLKELLEWATDVARPGAQRALTPGAPFKAGSWCQFCRIKKECLVRSAYLRERDTGSPSRESDFTNLDASEEFQIP